MESNIHMKMKKIQERRLKILLLYSKIDPNDFSHLSRLKRMNRELDKKYDGLRWELSRKRRE